MKPFKSAAILISVLILSGCGMTPGGGISQPPPGATAAPTASPANTAGSPALTGTSEDRTDLTRLLPASEGYEWMYEGFAEYSHVMELDEIRISEDTAVYRISGEVGDPSGGESRQDHSLSVTYTLTPGLWVQQASGPMLMDSDFHSIEILRGPLSEGTQWTQTVQNETKAITLLSAIDSVVETGDGGPVYTVTYKQKDGAYYERREIAAGRGIISFEKLYIPESGESFPISYRTYQQPQTPESPQPSADPSLKAGMDAWLPPLGAEMRFFGLAEYGHLGVLFREWEDRTEAVYRFSGIYNDGIGTADRFSVRYYLDYDRGTVTEMVMSNARSGKAEVNSRIHNAVLLKFPLRQGSVWHWEANFKGSRMTIEGQIVELSNDRAVARYTVEGVLGYYDDTYIEERIFEKGYGMTGFSMLTPGELRISPEDAKDPVKVRDALNNQLMFGYSQDKQWLESKR